MAAGAAARRRSRPRARGAMRASGAVRTPRHRHRRRHRPLAWPRRARAALHAGEDHHDFGVRIRALNEQATASSLRPSAPPVLTDALVEHLRPIQDRYQDVMQDQAYLDRVLRDGQMAADEEARKTLDNVKKAMGFYVM